MSRAGGGPVAGTDPSRGEPRRRTFGRRALWAAIYGAVGLLGLAGGVAVGVPGLVERAGLGAVRHLEERLGVEIAARSVSWSFDGDVVVEGLTVVDVGAPEAEAPLFVAERLVIASDVDLWGRRLRVRSIVVDTPVVYVVRRADGEDNVRRLAEGLRGLVARTSTPGSGGAGGGVARYLERAMPDVTLEHARVVIDAPPPELPLGLEVPRIVVFEDGRVRVAADDPTSPTELTLDAQFTETSLDPGYSLGVSLALAVSGEPRLVGATFERPVRFYLGRRVAGIQGFSWTPDAFEVSGLQLSVPLDPDEPKATVGAALTVERLAFAPEPRELLRRARAAGAVGAAGQGGQLAVASLIGHLDRVEVQRPAVALRFTDAGGHSFEDLLPASAPPPDADARAVGPAELLREASLSAAARLTQPPGADNPHLEALRARLSGVATGVEARVERLVRAAIAAAAAIPVASVDVTEGRVALSAPFGRLDAERVALTSRRDDEGARFSVELVIPEVTRRPARLDVKVAPGGAPVELAASVAGLPLAILEAVLPAPLVADEDGVVHDSALRLAWNGEGVPWSLDGSVQLTGATLRHPDLAPDPLRGLDVGFDFALAGDPAKPGIALTEGELRVGGVAIALRGAVASYPHRPTLELSARLAATPVQQVIDAFPRAMIPRLEGLTADGTLAWDLDLKLDPLAPAEMVLDSRPALRGFAVRSMGRTVDFELLRQAFTYPILRDDGTPGTRMTGPLTGRWVELEDISPWIVLAVTTTEDGSFYKHDGIADFAIRESIVTNLERGRFARGASTITQQLVKNLFLGGAKTLSRKLQEMFLAWRLEAELTKDEIMTLYLNVIEFGPGIYGVAEASERWFGKHPRDLTAVEAMFLSSIIPNPRRYYESFFEAGRVSPRWRDYLKTLLGVMVDRGKMTREEADAEAPYDPIFRGSGRAPAALDFDFDPPLPEALEPEE